MNAKARLVVRLPVVLAAALAAAVVVALELLDLQETLLGILFNTGGVPGGQASGGLGGGIGGGGLGPGSRRRSGEDHQDRRPGESWDDFQKRQRREWEKDSKAPPPTGPDPGSRADPNRQPDPSLKETIDDWIGDLFDAVGEKFGDDVSSHRDANQDAAQQEQIDRQAEQEYPDRP